MANSQQLRCHNRLLWRAWWTSTRPLFDPTGEREPRHRASSREASLACWPPPTASSRRTASAPTNTLHNGVAGPRQQYIARTSVTRRATPHDRGRPQPGIWQPGVGRVRSTADARPRQVPQHRWRRRTRPRETPCGGRAPPVSPNLVAGSRDRPAPDPDQRRQAAGSQRRPRRLPCSGPVHYF